jgi:hypothetical protein
MKSAVTGGMTVRAYVVLQRAVEEGIAYGWHKAHKYAEKPGEEAIKDHILNGVISEICEYFDFNETEE